MERRSRAALARLEGFLRAKGNFSNIEQSKIRGIVK